MLESPAVNGCLNCILLVVGIELVSPEIKVAGQEIWLCAVWSYFRAILRFRRLEHYKCIIAMLVPLLFCEECQYLRCNRIWYLSIVVTLTQRYPIRQLPFVQASILNELQQR